jgi:hypothetical protein
MSFQHFFGLGEVPHSSALANVPENLDRACDTELAVTGSN